MTEFESIISAMCITDVTQVEDLDVDLNFDGKPFRLFLEPISGGEVNVGDVVRVNGMLPYSIEMSKIPVAVGSWSPVLFTTIQADGINLTEVNAYVAPLKYYKQ